MLGKSGKNFDSYTPLLKQMERDQLLTKGQAKEILKQAKHGDQHIVDVLFIVSFAPAEKLLAALAEHAEVPAVRLKEKVISPYILNLIPKEVAEELHVVVFKKVRDVVHVATTTPENKQVATFIKKKTGFEPEVFVTTPDDLTHALKRYQTEISSEFQRIIDEGIRDAAATQDSTEQLAQHVPIIAMVDTIIERAVAQNASDIHIEPSSEALTVRFRIDGMLANVVTLPLELLAPIITRLKLMANVKIDEYRIPQDGRFSYTYNDREIVARVSIMPTLYGSTAVLRLLDAKQQQLNLRGLGLNANDLRTIRDQIAKPHGMVIVTGPTGSGKTTTLYTLLEKVNKPDVNICTIEDPIEYGLQGISQTQVNPTAGLTFANGLRSLLRQDPNIIMVGEMRDQETANIAVNAAMTGHLVFSTLHTNTAFHAFQRLVEMGVPPFLVASVTNLIIGQRLVRRVCQHCTVTARLTAKQQSEYAAAFDLDAIVAKLTRVNLLPAGYSVPTTFARGRGCAKCSGTGYLRRIGIYEFLPVDDALHAQVLKDASADAVSALAARQGALTMVEDGVLKVLQGLTTFEEVTRVTM
jgi:type IV pilus assembly protein PilB